MYLPSRTVLTCIGIDHTEFIDMTRDKFQSIVPIWQETPSVLGSKLNTQPVIDSRKSVWKGGSCIIEKDLSDLNQGSNNQMPVSDAASAASKCAKKINLNYFIN